MYKNALLLLFIILFNSSLFAQDWNEIYYLEGEAQYLVEEKDYDKAIDIYRRIVKEMPENAFAKYKIGKLYLLTDDQKTSAIGFLEEASQNIALDFKDKSLRETRSPADVLLYLGQAYQIAERVDEAIVVYNNFKNLIKQDHELYPIVLHQLTVCENAKQAIQHPLRVSTKNLGQPINNDFSNFNPVMSGDKNTLIYTSYTRNYIDVYAAQKENDVWSTPKKITDKISGKYYLKTSSLSYDGNQLFLTTDDPENNDIFISIKQGKNWTTAEKLGKTINGKKTNETHACVTKDGNTLYFTSDKEGGLGGLDIYKALKNAKGEWGEAVNLGPMINSKFDEETPYITSDGKYLFFSSQGHNSIGGFDIFYVDLENNTTATNLGYPANTMGNDLFFIPDNSIYSGYISRYDSTSLGKNDVFYLSILPKIYIAGNLKNTSSENYISDEELQITIQNSLTDELVKTATTSNGKFKFEINPGNYAVWVKGVSYEPTVRQINIPTNYSLADFPFEVFLNPLEMEPETPVAELIEATKPETITEQVEKPVIEASIPNEEIKEPVLAQKQEAIIPTKQEEPKKKIPETKEIAQYIPTSSASSGIKTYSVQLMALKVPVDISFFKNVEGVQLRKYDDGFYRYTVGMTSSYDEAQKLKEKINLAGYKDAYVRVNSISPRYTIQLMALIIPVELEYFKNLSSVAVTKGTDDYYRYTIGDYNDYSEAKQALSKIAELGYTYAYVKRY